jgi:integrase
MPNLRVSVVLYTEAKKWVKATGKKTDPAGQLYLRWYEGSKPKHIRAGVSWDEAEAAQARQIRKLKCVSQGFSDPYEVPAGAKYNDVHDCLRSYVEYLQNVTRTNGRRYNHRMTLAREAIIKEFLNTIPNKQFLEQINRADLARYKEWLYGKGRAKNTVRAKLMTVTNFLANNQLATIKLVTKGIMPSKVKRSEAHPFSDDDINKMRAIATPTEDLILRTFLATGARKKEVAYLEHSDLDPTTRSIKIQNKPKWGWLTKTISSEDRELKLNTLFDDLWALPDGVLFPTKRGRPNIHIDRIMKSLGERAGVKPPVGERACWCHRWRDSYASDQIRAIRNGTLHMTLEDVAAKMGHEDGTTMHVYVAAVTQEEEAAKQSARVSDRFTSKKPGPQLMKKTG